MTSTIDEELSLFGFRFNTYMRAMSACMEKQLHQFTFTFIKIASPQEKKKIMQVGELKADCWHHIKLQFHTE